MEVNGLEIPVASENSCMSLRVSKGVGSVLFVPFPHINEKWKGTSCMVKKAPEVAGTHFRTFLKVRISFIAGHFGL